MSRKHFEMLATLVASFADDPDSLSPESLADRLSERLSAENPRFDRSRFLSACKVGS